MSSLLRYFNVLSWPIWLKISSALVLVAMLPAVLGFLFIEQEVRSIDLENLRAYLVERGLERRDALSDNFTQIRVDLRDFAEDDAQRGLLLRLMSFGSSADNVLNPLREYMNERMVGSGLFSNVRALDAAGTVLLSSRIVVLGTVEEGAIPGTSEAETPAYRAFQSMTQLGEGQRWVVTPIEGGEARIELVQVVNNADGPVGYIVGTINNEVAVYDLLVGQAIFIDDVSYLVTPGNQIIAPDELVESARQSILSAPAVEALAQRAGTSTYEVDGQQRIAHYTPILDTPFALITETPLQVTFVQTLDRVYDQGFFLIFGLLIFGVIVALVLTQTITPGLNTLRQRIAALSEGDFETPVDTAERGDEIGSLSRTFVNMRDQVRALVDEQAERIAARVRDLQATQEVSRFAATQRDPQHLMDQVVNRVIDLFPNIYHAQIFMLDQNRQYAVLRASTGEAGQQLLRRGHRLAVGSVSVIGQVTEEGRVVVARDTSASGVHRRNEFLPDTRAELAIPLRLGDTLIGALDVQSKQSDSFTDDQINILQTMADQIAIALENTRLYQESVRRLGEIAAGSREATRRSWEAYFNYQRQQQIVFQSGMAENQGDALRQQALETQSAAIGTPTDHNTIPFAVPISLRGQVLGAVEWELPVNEFDNEKVQLAQELVNRLAFSLDNARLFQESQRATDRERLVNEITAKLTSQTDISEIMQTAVREVGRALRVQQVEINLASARRESANGAADRRSDGDLPDDVPDVNDSLPSADNGGPGQH
ncbi:MAG: GAF domain-containing protein [Chloroflexota bacterium]